MNGKQTKKFLNIMLETKKLIFLVDKENFVSNTWFRKSCRFCFLPFLLKFGRKELT